MKEQFYLRNVQKRFFFMDTFYYKLKRYFTKIGHHLKAQAYCLICIILKKLFQNQIEEEILFNIRFKKTIFSENLIL